MSAERQRRSESGAAVRRTRGSALGRAFAARRAARAEASARGGPQLAKLVLGPAGFDPLELRASSAIRRIAGPARWAFGPPPERAARTRRVGAVLTAELLRPLGRRPRRERRISGAWGARRGRTRQPEAVNRLLFLRSVGSPGRTPPHGRDAQRLLLAASTPQQHLPGVRPAYCALLLTGVCFCDSGRSQRGRKRALRSCRPTRGVAPARAVLRTAGFNSKVG